MKKYIFISVFMLLMLKMVDAISQQIPSQPSISPEKGEEQLNKLSKYINSNTEVTNSMQVESGSGVKVVKGDFEGEIFGKPFTGSKFDQLEIGMPMKQVLDIVGPPTDEGTAFTGKAWIPFYFGSDRFRYDMLFKGQGRLVFASGSLKNYGNGHLIWIIYNKNESGYRK